MILSRERSFLTIRKACHYGIITFCILKGKGVVVNTARSGKQTSACRRCGECCRIRGFVRVSNDEVDCIAELLGISPNSFAERYTRLAQDRCGLELEEKENGECVFLEGAECVIHAVKPRQCRTFPDAWRYPGVEEICPAYKNDETR